ncbi:MAG: CBS domain-containing protein [Kiritimatiellia bacterium]
MKTVSDLLKNKPPEVWTISPDATAFAALQLMAEKEIGAIVVVDKKGEPVGMFSERDYARKVILKGRSSKTTLVKDLMSRPVLFVRPDHTIEECMALMTEKRVRHLPVIEKSKLVGIVSIGDVVKAIIADQQFTIRQLENYITGTL